MLILSRHREEKIMLGDDIVITVVEIRGDKIKLGIDAPSAVPVHRLEVYEAIQHAKAKQPPIVAEAAMDVKPPTMSERVKRKKAKASA